MVDSPDCRDCAFWGYDMDMDPFCTHPAFKDDFPWGRTLVGKSNARASQKCGPEGKLFKDKNMTQPNVLAIPDRLIARHRAWSIGNFGTNSERGGTGPLRHMIKEAQEVIDVIEMGGEDIDYDALAEEMGDIMFLFLDTMYRTKLPCEMLVSAMEQKMPILELRNYPKTADGVPSEHVKGEDE